jgi:AAA15 family ATPase/GTPase
VFSRLKYHWSDIGEATINGRMIEEISIRNFKSIEESKIGLKNINIIIGSNNSGKSNLLDAFVLYGQLLAVKLQEVFGPGPYSFRNLFFRGGDIKTDSMDFDIKYRDRIPISHSFSLEDYRNPSSTFPSFLLRIKKEIISINGIDETNSMADELRIRNEFTNHQLDADTTDFVRLCRGIRKFQFVPKEIKRERAVDPLVQGVPFLLTDGSNLVNVLFGIRDANNSTFEAIMTDFKSIFTDVSGLSFRHLGESRYALEFTRKVNGKDWRFIGPEISDGFVIALAVFTLIHLPNAQPNASRIILIEEIENGLNPNTLRIMLERLIKASKKYNIQFIITTHSPIILEHMSQSPEYVIVCDQQDGHSKYVSLPEILSKFGDDYEPGESLFNLWFEGHLGGL